MQKKTKRRITNLESQNRRRLELSRETVRVLGANDLSQAVGGSATACDTTSWTSWSTSKPSVI
jgi:hypothetical protein